MSKQLKTVGEFAALVKLHRTTVHKWIREGMPAAKHGNKYLIDLCQAVPWMVQKFEEAKPAGSARERLAEVQADKVELDNERERKNLLRLDHMTDVRDAMLKSLDDSLAGMPDRLGSALADETNPALCRQIVLDAHHEARQVHAQDLQDIFEGKVT